MRAELRGLQAALVSLVFVAGCVSDQAHRYYAAERYPPRDPESVDVLFKTPTRPYEVIADFQARRAKVEYMREEAAKIGADAVIVGHYGGYRSRNDEWASEDKYADSYSRLTGTAIRYKK